MRSFRNAGALLTALAASACMKPDAIDVTGDGQDDLVVRYDDLLWAPGDDARGSVIAVPLELRNLTRGDLDVSGWDVAVRTADGRTCRARTSEEVVLGPREARVLLLTAPCGPSRAAPEGAVRVDGTLRYTLAGQARTLPLAEVIELVA